MKDAGKMRISSRLGVHEGDEALQKAIQHKTEKLQQRLKRYHPEVAQLALSLEQSEGPERYVCKLHLRLFRDSLHARKQAAEVRVALDRAFDALFKELEHYRQKVNKSL